MSKTLSNPQFEHFERLFRLRQFDEAEQFLHSLKESEILDQSFFILFSKIRLYNKMGQYAADDFYFLKAIDLIKKADSWDISLTKKSIINIEYAQILHAQNKSMKSLTLLKESHDFFEKILDNRNLVLSKIALGNWYLDANDFGLSLEYGKAAEQLTQIVGQEQDEWVLRILNLIGRIHIKKQEYDNALEYSEKALTIAISIGDVEQELIALNNIAISNVTKSHYQVAMEIFMDVLDRSSDIEYRPMIARCQINIGSINAQLFNFDEASKRYEAALDNYFDCLSSSTAVVLYNNIGNASFSLLEYDKAENSFNQCLQLAIEANYQEMIAHTYAQLAKTFIAKNKYKKAEKHALKAQKLMQDLPEIAGIQINLLNLAQIAFFNQDFDSAFRFASKGIVMSKSKNDDFSKIRGYQLLADIHHAKGDFENAYRFLLIHKAVQQEFSQLQYARQVLDVEIKHVINEKQHEIERLQTENEWQSKLLEQQDELKKTNAQLIEVNSELRQFEYVASHDLKEPIRMIKSYSKILEDKYGNQLDAKGLEYLGYVKNGATRMNDLIDGLLKYSLIGKDEPILKFVNLKDVIYVCLSNLRLLVANTQAEIIVGDLPEIWGDFNLLIQLFQNFITNAIKFVEKGVSPIIHITSEKSKNSIVIHIKDNGIGINEYDQEEIFNIFRRLHTKTNYEGSGIGLAICQKIVQKMNGSIHVESQEGQGTTFSVVLPPA